MPMAMTADDILAHPALERCVRSQAQSLLSIQQTSPRIASLFATQQRWLMAHVDGLDGGGRMAAFHARPALLSAIQPLIADGLIGSGEVRKPPKTFELFTWIDEGGLVMDRGERISTDVTSISAFARHLNVSRTHLGRKFSEAEAFGSLGWSGARGRSPLWVSAGFRREYHAAQAVKLAIIDAAFEASILPGSA